MLEGQIQTAAFWWKQTLAGAASRLCSFLITCLLIRLPQSSAWAQAASSNNLSLEYHWLADIGREQEKVLGFWLGGNWFTQWLAFQIPLKSRFQQCVH